MIKEAIEKILGLAEIQTKEIDNLIYVKDEQRITRLKKPGDFLPAPLQFNTLNGLVDYIKVNPDNHLGMEENFFIHILDYNQVDLLTNIDPENNNKRFSYAMATSNKQKFPFNRYMDLEDMVINMQAGIAPSADYDEERTAVIEMLGNIANETIQNNTDDGFTQSIQIKTGLTTKSKVKIKNPVMLCPWRTFDEINQPPVACVLRFKQSQLSDKTKKIQAALYDSNNEKWRLIAIADIKKYLEDNLPNFKILA